MKWLLYITILLLSFTGSTLFDQKGYTTEPIRGAWIVPGGSEQLVLLIEDDYLSITSFNEKGRKFFYTKGGVLKLNGANTEVKWEFNSKAKDSVGKISQGTFRVDGDQLLTNFEGAPYAWKKLDTTRTDITGCWRIKSRVNNGEMVELKRSGRKTLKILSGTRFQWIAINTETGEFSGTGGGTYTLNNGKYIEHIKFFSRDSSRVGAELSFEGKVENGVWHHKGRSSTGNPVNEQWVKH